MSTRKDSMTIAIEIERWHSVEQVADYLGVKRDTLYKWIERKHLPAHKVGKLWKFKLSEVDNWVRTSKKK